jgi:hypothetical protein
MIPQGGIGNAQIVQQPSRTYKIDLENNRMIGITDNLDAVKQAAYKILQTERFEFEIYSGNYGVELAGVPGSSPEFVQAEMGRRIRSALLCDDRISDVEGLKITVVGDEALAEFTVVSIYGKFNLTKGV